MTFRSSSAISENSIVFFEGGHDHDGVSSSLIDTEQYSIYDFIVGKTGSNARQIRQQRNFDNLKTVISNVVINDVLGPSGVRLLPNSVQSIHIAAGSITANELSANVALINNVIRSSNFDGTIAANGVITSDGSTGWAITWAGDAVFDSTVIRGTITAGAIYINTNNYWYSNGSFKVGNNTNSLIYDGSDLTLNGEINANTGTIAGWEIGPGDYLRTGGSFLGDMTIGEIENNVRVGMEINGPSGPGQNGYSARIQYDYITISQASGDGVVLYPNGNIVSTGTISSTGVDVNGNLVIQSGGLLDVFDIDCADITADEITTTDMIRCGGTGVYYNASNLSGDRFGIAFGWDQGGYLSCIVDNNAGVAPYFAPDGYYSDRRLKDNIINIDNDLLNKIYSVKTYQFKYKDDIPYPWIAGKNGIGVIADEFAELFPEYVENIDNPEKYQQVVYVKSIPLLLTAITDLNQRLSAIEQQLGYNS